VPTVSIIKVITVVVSLAQLDPEPRKTPGIQGFLLHHQWMDRERPWVPLTVYEQPDLAAIRRTITVAEDLKVQEFGYEANYGLIVLERKGTWARVALKDSTGWVVIRKGTYFEDVDFMFGPSDNDYDHWTGEEPLKLSTAPGRVATLVPEQPVKALRIRDRIRLKDGIWLRIEILDLHSCDGEQRPAKVLMQGWAPLRDPAGRLNFWWYTRGC
jgi:hypothetical protein